MAFLPADFEVPTLLETDRFRLRPISVEDLDMDYEAVMSSRQELWRRFGQAWAGRPRTSPWSRTARTCAGTRRSSSAAPPSTTRSWPPTSPACSAVSTSTRPPRPASTPRSTCGFGPVRPGRAWRSSWTRPSALGGRPLALPAGRLPGPGAPAGPGQLLHPGQGGLHVLPGRAGVDGAQAQDGAAAEHGRAEGGQLVD